MRNAKKTVVVIALIALMAIPSMMAYFTDTTETKTNTFTVGNVDIELVDNFDTDDAANIVAGDVISKNVTVKNIGASDAYVFIKVEEPTDKLYSDIDFSTGDEGAWTPLEGEAGVYYYNTTLAKKGEEATTATSLFTNVTFPTDLENKTGTFDIKVTGYAVQAEEFENATAAWKATFGAPVDGE